jgi:hypothetical protein
MCHQRVQHQPQSRSEKSGDRRGSQARSVSEFYAARLAKDIRPELARLTLARKIAAIT